MGIIMLYFVLDIPNFSGILLSNWEVCHENDEMLINSLTFSYYTSGIPNTKKHLFNVANGWSLCLISLIYYVCCSKKNMNE